MWDHLKKEYGTPGLPVIFSHFKAVLLVIIPMNLHPSPALNDFNSCFDKLKVQEVDVPEFVCAMIILLKLPPSMEYIYQVFYQKATIVDIKFDEVCCAINIYLEQHETSHHATNSGTANKLSTIKQKQPNPGFCSQQHHL